MTLLKPSMMSRSLRLSSSAFTLANGMLLEDVPAFNDLTIPTAWAASTVRSLAVVESAKVAVGQTDTDRDPSLWIC